ncbi:TlpA family protein disulfide reductase [Nonlabens sp. YIK11]|uniref:TlpA family protein disulfide reductase n=1 Tax=Nonlabens sp. YIK11 TaxID=1453349 RepID=UPI0006DC7B4B|nr:TlpA disulfide reductase family protein [Nonlabens sp. YIK11]
MKVYNISYDGRKDSSIVENGQFKFQGNLTKSQSVIFTSKKVFASKRQFYLENSDVSVELSFEKKYINPDLTIDWFTIKDSKGSETDSSFIAFNKFKTENQTKPDWNKRLYSRLEKIFQKYPDSELSADLLYDETLDSILTNKELRKLYSYINWSHQDPFRKYQTAKNIMPEKYDEIGTELKDFTLLNEKGVQISPKDFRGKYLFVDFWATWCVPCREEFPALNLIYNQYNNKGFDMLAVSIDDQKGEWLEVIYKDQFKWSNVHSKKGVEGEIVQKFNLYSIPTNYLLDKTGIIIAKDFKPTDLENFLKNNLKTEQN